MSAIQPTFQVFTLHDPRLPDEKSCVYVGTTSREDVEQCISSVVKKQFAELLAELEQESQSEHHQVDVRLHGRPREQEAASDLKFKLISTSCQRLSRSALFRFFERGFGFRLLLSSVTSQDGRPRAAILGRLN